jgi:hypothetical protein
MAPTAAPSIAARFRSRMGRLRTLSGTVLCCYRGFAVLAIWQSAVALLLRRRIARLAAAVGQRAAAAS